MPVPDMRRALLLLCSLLCAAASRARSQVPADGPAAMIVEAPNGPWSLRIGERFRGTTLDGRRIEGRVLSLVDSSIVVGRRRTWAGVPGDSLRVTYADLARIEAHRPPRHRATAMAVGALAGLALGATIGAASVKTSCHGDDTLGPCFSRGTGAFAGGSLGVMLGSGTAWLLTRSRWELLSVARPASYRAEMSR